LPAYALSRLGRNSYEWWPRYWTLTRLRVDAMRAVAIAALARRRPASAFLAEGQLQRSRLGEGREGSGWCISTFLKMRRVKVISGS